MQNNKPIIITMASLKGGVGKSTLSILFSYILKDLGKKVLLIDLDPQNSLTSFFLKYALDIEKYNIYSFLKGECNLGDSINKIYNNFDFIASHPLLKNFNNDAIKFKESILEFRLKKNIERYNYDYILIDTRPAFDELLINALNVSDHIIIPVQVERWAIESLKLLLLDIEDIQEIKDKKFNISIVENLFIKNRNALKEFEDVLYENYGNYIKGKIHATNNLTILIRDLSEPYSRENYYKEAESTLKNILNL